MKNKLSISLKLIGAAASIACIMASAACTNSEDALLEEFKKATAEGRVGIGTLVKRAALPSTTIRLDPEDIAKARVQAAKRGLRYQTYLKMIIHEALRNAESERESAA